MRRRKITRRGSRKLFRKTATRVHKKNMPRTIMRGGYRL